MRALCQTRPHRSNEKDLQDECPGLRWLTKQTLRADMVYAHKKGGHMDRLFYNLCEKINANRIRQPDLVPSSQDKVLHQALVRVRRLPCHCHQRQHIQECHARRGLELR